MSSSLINEKYEKVVCLSLKEREDKYEFSKYHFKKYGIDVEFFRPVIFNFAKHFIDPYTEKNNNPSKHHLLFNPQFPNEFGTFISHYTIIKTALLEGIQTLFVFEDDCAFHKDWDTLLPKYFNTIPEDADGILLYSYMSQLEPQNVRVKPRWTKGFASWSFLAYGLNRRAMEGYIAHMDKHPMVADKGSWDMMTYGGYNFYIASPPLVIPARGLTSNIRGEDKNYEKTHFQGGNVFTLGLDTNNYE